MSRNMTQDLPRRRETGIVTREISDEVLIYDLETHKAHCLNTTATHIWKRCDGKTSVTQLAQILTQDLKTSIDDDVIWLALDQLEKLHLLDRTPTLPRRIGMTRRTMMRNMGLATAVALPLVTSLIAPTPAQAATCLPSGQACSTSSQCCSGVCNMPAGTCA
jgi:hypothetical protein